MKRLLFIFCLLTAFIACDDNDKNDPTPPSPIENLEMPSATTPFTTGQTVTIKGKGFTENSQIWLRNVTKAEGDIQATIIQLDDKSISFTVPANVSGDKQVILIQGGKEHKLGILTFKINPEKLYAIIQDHANYGLAQLNLDEKKFSMLLKIETNTIIYQPVMLKHKIFYISFNDPAGIGDLKCYDLDTKQETVIIPEWTEKDGCAIGVIDNQLHAVNYNLKDGFSLKKINDDGSENEVVQTFSINSNLKDFGEHDNKFEYDPIDKIILLSGYSFDNSSDHPEDIGTLIALNINTKEVKIESDPEKVYQCANREDKIYLFTHDNTSATDIGLLNPLTLANEKITTINRHFDNPIYLKSKNAFLGITPEKKLGLFELSTKEISTVWEDIEIFYLW